MRATQVAARCAGETGASSLSQYGEEIALIAIATAEEDMRAWRRRIRSEFRSRHPECGSILLMVLIPIIVNLVSAWLARWIFKESPTDLDQMRTEASIALKS